MGREVPCLHPPEAGRTNISSPDHLPQDQQVPYMTAEDVASFHCRDTEAWGASGRQSQTRTEMS